MSEWISVKDRLPEQGVDVLVAARGMGTDVFKFGYEYIDIDALHMQRYGRANSFRIDMLSARVTHWMPLPEFPEDTDEE